MKARILLLALLVALSAVVLTRGAGEPPSLPAPVVPPAVRPPLGNQYAAPLADVQPARNPFRYADEDEPSEALGGLEAEGPSPVPTPATAPAAPLRLVGFLRHAGRLRAALSLQGEVVLAAPGDELGGFVVLSVDEDAGVVLRDARGTETSLR